jgi:hypothetical protein
MEPQMNANGVPGNHHRVGCEALPARPAFAFIRGSIPGKTAGTRAPNRPQASKPPTRRTQEGGTEHAENRAGSAKVILDERHPGPACTGVARAPRPASTAAVLGRTRLAARAVPSARRFARSDSVSARWPVSPLECQQWVEAAAEGIDPNVCSAPMMDVKPTIAGHPKRTYHSPSSWTPIGGHCISRSLSFVPGGHPLVTAPPSGGQNTLIVENRRDRGFSSASKGDSLTA